MIFYDLNIFRIVIYMLIEQANRRKPSKVSENKLEIVSILPLHKKNSIEALFGSFWCHMNFNDLNIILIGICMSIV